MFDYEKVIKNISEDLECGKIVRLLSEVDDEYINDTFIIPNGMHIGSMIVFESRFDIGSEISLFVYKDMLQSPIEIKDKYTTVRIVFNKLHTIKEFESEINDMLRYLNYSDSVNIDFIHTLLSEICTQSVCNEIISYIG